MNRDEGSYQLSHAYDRFLDATADRRTKTRKNWVPASSAEDPNQQCQSSGKWKNTECCDDFKSQLVADSSTNCQKYWHRNMVTWNGAAKTSCALLSLKLHWLTGVATTTLVNGVASFENVFRVTANHCKLTAFQYHCLSLLCYLGFVIYAGICNQL